MQLVQGKPGTEQIILDNPVEVALEWENRGAKILHVIDLGGALEEGGNLSVGRNCQKSFNTHPNGWGYPYHR